ncbi:MAG: PD-(D/E)XK nuclease family protein [Elusimicrobiaceae bacterium]|nr:PD-(D/E)XK nuclease family protein [Elusimicrobiaceae bacterium]
MAKNLSFSYSKMGMYKECPQKYKFRYVHMLPEKPKYYFAFGSALHAVMEFIYNPQKPVFPTLTEALKFFDTTWNKTSFEQKGYASVEKELEGYAEGRRILESYYAQNAAAFTHPLSVETKSTLEIDGLNLISILDRMDYLGDGKIKILDYKTGKTVQREPDQLYMYQKVVENSPVIKALVQAKDPSVKEVRVGELSFYHLPTLTEMKFERAPDKEIFSFWQGVLKIADSIRAGKFDPTPGENQCRWCDYRNLCPVFTGKEYGASSSVKETHALPPTAQNPQEELSQKIDRLGELRAEAKKLEQEIITLMQQNKFERHFGSTFKAELNTCEKVELTDNAQVVELLTKLGLLDKVLVPTKTTVVRLLTDDTVSAKDKEQLRALVRRVQEVQLALEKIAQLP